MTETLKTFRSQIVTAEVRREIFQNVEHLVVPTVALVEGLIHGSFIGADDLGFSLLSWNNRPVTINHPTLQGHFVSANTNGVAEAWQVGRIFKPTLTDNKLRVEMWLNIEQVQALEFPEAGDDGIQNGTQLIEAMESGDVIEVSTGFFSNLEQTQGVFNGEEWSGIHRNVNPDHLAILPNDIGACSIEDGCGAARFNQANGGNVEKPTLKERVLTALTESLAFLEVNQITTTDLRELMVISLEKRFPGRLIWIREIFVGEGSSVVWEFEGNEKFQLGFTLGENDMVILATGEPKQVLLKTEVMELTTNEESDDEISNQNEREKETPMAEKTCDCPPVVATVEPQAADTVPQTIEQRIDAVGDSDIKALAATQLATQQSERKELVDKLVANERCDFTSEQLEGFDTDALNKLITLSETPTEPTPNFEGRSGGATELTNQSDEDFAPLSPVVNIKREAV